MVFRNGLAAPKGSCSTCPASSALDPGVTGDDLTFVLGGVFTDGPFTNVGRGGRRCSMEVPSMLYSDFLEFGSRCSGRAWRIRFLGGGAGGWSSVKSGITRSTELELSRM